MNGNPFSLKGKNILITGASSGIGQKCAIVCSEMGANVILVARRKERLTQTLSQLTSGNHLMFPFDVTDFANIEFIIKEAVSKVGLINGFVHSAGTEFTMPLSSTKPENYDNLFKTNVISAFEFSKILAKKKYSQNLSIVFIASVMSFLGEVGHTAYCSSKGALIAGCKAMALELVGKKIRVNTICPAQIRDTEITENMLSNFTEENKKNKLEMHPLGYGDASDVAYASVYLLSEASKWVTGTNLIVDGGYSAK